MAGRRGVQGSMSRVVAAVAVALAVVIGVVVAAPGSSRQARADVPANAGAFTPLTLTRIVDTRKAENGPQGPFAPGARIDLTVAGRGGVPASGVTAVALNVTLVNSARSGWVRIQPAGTSAVVSTLNVTGANATRANFAIVALGAGGAVSVDLDAGGDVVLDVAGYWTVAATSTAGRYVALSPARLFDSRTGGAPRLAGNAITTIARPQLLNVPADATAVAVTVTATDTTTQGHVTAWPTSTTMPTSSVLNFGIVGETVPNLAIVPLAAGGGVQFTNSSTAHLVVDLVGYVTGTVTPTGTDGLFVPLTPARVVDSRNEQGTKRLWRGQFTDVSLTNVGGIPASGVGAVAVNLTMTNATAGGFALAWPARTARPLASTTNFLPGRDVAAGSIVALGTGGVASLLANAPADTVIDVAGWFLGTPLAATNTTPPRACGDTMAFLHSPTTQDAGFIYLRDLSGRLPDTWVNLGLDVAAVRMAPNCDYLLAVVPNATLENRYDVYYIENFVQENPAAARVTAVRMLAGVPWRSFEISANSRWVFAYWGTLTNAGVPRADIVAAYDTRDAFRRRSGALVFPANALHTVSAALPDHLLVSTYRSGDLDGTMRMCPYANSSGAADLCLTLSPRSAGINAARYFNHQIGHWTTIVDRVDGVYVLASVPDTLIEAQTYLPRFTMAGQPVLSIDEPATGRVGVWRYTLSNGIPQPPATAVKLLDNVNNHSPAFSRRWRNEELSFGPNIFTSQSTGAANDPSGEDAADAPLDLDRCQVVGTAPAAIAERVDELPAGPSVYVTC